MATFIDHREVSRILAKYYNPTDPITRVFWKNPAQSIRFHFGIVNDNKDPDKKGRIKVAFPHWHDNMVSDWSPIIRPFSGTQMGMFVLPEIDEPVLCLFLNDNANKPLVMGSLRKKDQPPPVADNPDNNIKKIVSRSGISVTLDDKDGEEKIEFLMKEGKVVLLLDKAKGIKIINELGDIKIKCKKFKLEGKDTAQIKLNKELSLTTDNGELKFTSTKDAQLKSGGNTVIKGSSKIKIKGMTAANNKAIARKDDQVVGVDIHQVKVPAGNSLIDVPLPHPYVGKLTQNLSTNVENENRAVATKGSKSKHVDPGHIPTPPGVSWSGGSPSNMGEVSSLTEPTVKVNDKEIAVLGSMVKTCNFPNDQETCSIIAIGAAVKIPIIIPGVNDKANRDNNMLVVNTRNLIAKPSQKTDKTPKLTNAKWSKTSAKTGDELTVSVQCSNLYENANVVFKIFKETEKDKPIARISGQNKGGKAEAKIQLNEPAKDAEDDKIKYFFKAASFKCDEVKSSNLTVEKIKPEFTNLKWYSIADPKDKNSKEEEISKTDYGLLIRLSADVKNVDEGNTVKVRIYEKGYRDENDFKYIMIADVKNNKLQLDWQARCSSERLDELTENDELKYVYILECDGVKSKKSPELQLTFWTELVIDVNPDELDYNDEFILASTDNSYSKSKKAGDDKIPGDDFITLKFDDLKPGLKYNLEHKDRNIKIFENVPFKDLIN